MSGEVDIDNPYIIIFLFLLMLYVQIKLFSAMPNNLLGPELQYLLKVKDDLSYVLISQDAKNNV